MYRKVFISYAKEDYTIAEKLFDFLLNNGFEPWLDKKNLVPGQDWDYEINKALKDADYIIIIFSDISISKIGYVQREYKLALRYCEERPENTIYIIPVVIGDCQLPERFRKYQWIKLSDKESFNLIMTSLNIQYEVNKNIEKLRK